MDWSPLSGFVGALLGASASYFGSRQVLNQQLKDNRQARGEAERRAVTAALSQALTALLEHVALMPGGQVTWRGDFDLEEREGLRAPLEAWDQQWQPLIRSARMAALEVRSAELR